MNPLSIALPHVPHLSHGFDFRSILPLLPLQPQRRTPTLRRVRAADAEPFQRFVMALSPASRRLRFHGTVNSCSPALLQYLTQVDQIRHQAWLALLPRGSGEVVVGEARFVFVDDRCAEFAVAVADEQRGRGVADELMRTLLATAARAGVHRLYGDVLEGNGRMGGLLRRHGFRVGGPAGGEPGVERWQRLLQEPRPVWSTVSTTREKASAEAW